MTLLTPALAFLAGILTILSPCVLPLAPILASSAVAQHRFGPAALALGLATSFSLVGLFVATLGFSLNLDGELLRRIGAALMIAIGLVLVTSRLQLAVATAAAPISDWANARTAGVAGDGLLGQAGLGALLGVVWSPCVGPTLGAATILAAQGDDLFSVAIVMAAFGLGAALVLITIGYAARSVFVRHRSKLHAVGEGGKRFLGAALLLVGLLVLSGLDRAIEAFLVEISPAWLTTLTTRL